MHITLEADYAVRIVICLARNNKRTDATSISKETGVSLRFSLKILRNLVGAGIAKSFKGTNGGYELNKKPEEITLGEILEAIEGEYAFSRCIKDGGECTNPKSSECKVKRIFAEVTASVQKSLAEYTIRDVM